MIMEQGACDSCQTMGLEICSQESGVAREIAGMAFRESTRPAKPLC